MLPEPDRYIDAAFRNRRFGAGQIPRTDNHTGFRPPSDAEVRPAAVARTGGILNMATGNTPYNPWTDSNGTSSTTTAMGAVGAPSSYWADSATPEDGNGVETIPVARTYWEDGEVKKEYYWGQEGKGNYWDLDPISRESVRVHEDVHPWQQQLLHGSGLVPWLYREWEKFMRDRELSSEEEMRARFEEKGYLAEYDFLTNYPTANAPESHVRSATHRLFCVVEPEAYDVPPPSWCNRLKP